MMTFSILKMQSGWLPLVITQQFCLGSGARAPTPRGPMNGWLDSSLNCIQIGKLEMKISIANILSWPASFTVLFNGMLPYRPSPCQT